MKRAFHKIFRRQSKAIENNRGQSKAFDGSRQLSILLLCSLFLVPCSFPEIRTRLSPSAQRTLESAGAVLVYQTPATVNGAEATLGAYTFPAPPTAATAETARLLNLPAGPVADGAIISTNNTRLIVLPAADPRKSLLLLTQFDTAPDPSRAIEFPKNLPRPENAVPTFSATLEATQTSFAVANSQAAPEAVQADMARRLAALSWQAALPATPGQSLALYERGNATFIVHTAPQPDGTTRLALLQRLTSNPQAKTP